MSPVLELHRVFASSLPSLGDHMCLCAFPVPYPFIRLTCAIFMPPFVPVALSPINVFCVRFFGVFVHFFFFFLSLVLSEITATDIYPVFFPTFIGGTRTASLLFFLAISGHP